METDYRKALEPHVGEQVTVYPTGIDPIKGTLAEGPMFYSVRGESGMLILMPGHPARIETRGGTIDLAALR